MTERIGISLILVVIAVAQLVTDIVRLALEVAPRPAVYEAAPAPTRSGEQEMPRPPPSREQVEEPPGAAAHWRIDRRSGMAADRTYRRLPVDFSINQPPWCVVCRHRDPPRYERRHRDDW
jgi:hypothetical protein